MSGRKNCENKLIRISNLAWYPITKKYDKFDLVTEHLSSTYNLIKLCR